MALLGGSLSGADSVDLLVWLLLLQPLCCEAWVGGEGAQGGLALPSLSPIHSVGSLETLGRACGSRYLRGSGILRDPQTP